MHMCSKCSRLFGVLVLALGILFLLQDLAVWNFWNISWFTAVFLLVGLAKMGRCHCKECEDIKKKK